jgi:hypothetical protein
LQRFGLFERDCYDYAIGFKPRQVAVPIYVAC